MKYRIMYTQVREGKTFRWQLTTKFDSLYEAVLYLGGIAEKSSIAFHDCIEITIEEDK